MNRQNLMVCVDNLLPKYPLPIVLFWYFAPWKLGFFQSGIWKRWMSSWGRDHLMGGCGLILVTETMSRAPFMMQLYVEQQEMRNPLPVSRYSTDPKWKLRWNHLDSYSIPQTLALLLTWCIRFCKGVEKRGWIWEGFKSRPQYNAHAKTLKRIGIFTSYF